MKPYNTKEELMNDFDTLFPSRKDDLKIIVAEVNSMIVFALHLFIERRADENRTIGHIYDLLINRPCYWQLSRPDVILKSMIVTLEIFALLHNCDEVIFHASLIDDRIMEGL